MNVTRQIIEIDEELCDGCGQCVPACAEGALKVIDGKARLVAEKYCDGLGACLGECPTGALKVIEREVEAFDERAVQAHVAEARAEPQACPSARMHRLEPGTAAPTRAASALTHWPVQIRLVPPTAPFLQGADLLVAADCVTVACANFHSEFLEGKVVMVGCPKFDDAELYVQRFADIFRAADVRSVTTVVMEVPCCRGLPAMVEKGMALAGKRIPLEKVVVSLQGAVLSREAMAT